MKYPVKTQELPLSLPDRRIYGKAYIPERGGALSAVILSHGYNSSHEAVSDLARALAETGVFAYCYDFCGGSAGSKSSGSPEEMSISSEISDLRAVIGFIGGMENIADISLYGESQGGFVSALAADGGIRRLYLLYPAFCIPDDWKKRMADGIPDKIELMGMTLSRKFCEGLPEYDVFERISRYKGAVRIFHGDADGLVPLSYSEKAAESFPNAELTVFGGEGHGFSPEARARLIEMICGSLRK